MKRAIQFRVRLMEAGIFILFILLLGFSAGVRSAYKTRDMNQWVSHTQQVLTEAASVRLHRARMQNDLWFYRATEREEFLERYRANRQKLMMSASQLRELIKDNLSRQESSYQVSALLEQQVALLDRALEEAQSAEQSHLPQKFTVVIPADDPLPALMDTFEAAEHGLFAERSLRLQKSADLTFALLLITGVVACSSLPVSGYYIQREILARAEIEDGLRRARELMGSELDQQKSELGDAMDGLHRHILARNMAEEEMRRLNLELEARVARRTEELAEMNRELESFNYSVSHDLRAPLRHMDGFSRILEQEFGPQLSSEARHYLRRIRLTAGQMTALVDDLLQLARFGRKALKRQSIALDKLVEETIAANIQDEPGREILWRISPLPEIEADPGLMRQVLSNLISNALKFTKNKAPAEIEIGSTQSGSQITVFVKDNGTGFAPRYSDKRFGVFRRLHRHDEFEGTGIGLAIVARVIHKHGGRVWAESVPDRGARFYFTAKAAQEVPVSKIEAGEANA